MQVLNTNTTLSRLTPSKRRYYVLQNYNLYWYKKPTDPVPKGSFPTKGSTVSSLVDVPGKPFSFSIQFGSQKLVLSCELAVELTQWLDVLVAKGGARKISVITRPGPTNSVTKEERAPPRGKVPLKALTANNISDPVLVNNPNPIVVRSFGNPSSRNYVSS
jgi:hypothetical protein